MGGTLGDTHVQEQYLQHHQISILEYIFTTTTRAVTQSPLDNGSHNLKQSRSLLAAILSWSHQRCAAMSIQPANTCLPRKISEIERISRFVNTVCSLLLAACTHSCDLYLISDRFGICCFHLLRFPCVYISLQNPSFSRYGQFRPIAISTTPGWFPTALFVFLDIRAD
ncbi:hypothetical protein BD779DRAFT_560517 [Infundibulicybe gibba]|nr:hypothetical protein BD779DRAFT_560517 [Infundibulicybe gibba]